LFERGKGKWSDFDSREKKSSFTLINTTKKGYFAVTEFFSTMRVYPMCFFSLELALYGRSKPANNFGFWLIVGFQTLFLGFFLGNEYISQGV
jgi:hypothetical protein